MRNVQNDETPSKHISSENKPPTTASCSAAARNAIHLQYAITHDGLVGLCDIHCSVCSDKQQELDLSPASANAGDNETADAAAGASGSAASSGTSLSRRGSSAGSSSHLHHSFIKKKPSKKLAPMSQIPGIKQPSKQHQSKRANGVLPKYGVQGANADLLNEVRWCTTT
jgi:hypothetical protein